MSPLSPRTSQARYTAPAIALHWLLALLLLAAFTLGLIMTDLPLSPQKLRFYSWHKWLGVTIFLLGWLRFFWRLTHRPPPLPLQMPVWQQRISAWVHGFLYLVLLLLPLSGWLFSSASGYQTIYLGIFPLPDLIEKSKPVASFLKEVHEYLGVYLLSSLVIVHIAAVFKHQWIDRDGLFWRMWWARKFRIED